LVVDRTGQKDSADDGNGTPQIGTRTSVTGDIDDVGMCLNPSVDLFTRWYASVTSGGKILRTQIEIPNEYLEDGLRGYRAFIVDYDSSNDAALLRSPDFHAFMTYGIVMKTLSRFEYALGRRWDGVSVRIRSKSRRMHFRMQTRFIQIELRGFIYRRVERMMMSVRTESWNRP
jgi:hypothetical protein